MDSVEIFKALSNKARLDILSWLRDPDKHFPAECVNADGVCVGHIKDKLGLTQSTVSEYLSLLQRAGLITATRNGQWTLYKRNEEGIAKLSQYINQDL
ncbi:MAG: helix-turn-helix transcriptional regulator [Mucilaginibacter polytrichastri]|nr:helix-turn-helix transcriptional regulator [Mucilaginibacter polytrichastri]